MSRRKAGLFERLPLWLLAAMLIAVVICWEMAADANYTAIFHTVRKGLAVTLYVSFIAYAMSLLLGLVLGLWRVSRSRILREVATFYIEIVRGIPMLVILYYIAFVGAPGLVDGLNWLLTPLRDAGLVDKISVRSLDFTWRAILALTVGYSAFIAEIVRAGVESVAAGQMEAARSLGLSRWQAMYKVILPQALRNVMPPLANDFVAMLKDSALVSALGVQDITQLGKVYSASTFLFFETYNVVAFLYLVMTISLSLCIRWFECRHKRPL
ncbi:amino acid ABC transporter permease [Oleidesulfovibrio sp.]|uniref:amino acid ABC transporter permease n=1 Tax=Oleidesulfovibrio sp. TaxID=2909707 RepID=UPI003A8543F4